MQTSLVAAIRSAVEQAFQTGRVSGIIVAVARRDAAPSTWSFGVDAAGVPLTPETVVPVASITKLATALVVLHLVDCGAVALDEPLGRYVPDASAARITIRSLLCHTSGLPLDLPEGRARYGPGLDWPARRAAALATDLEAPPGKRVQYSNVGYSLLAALVERQTGMEFAKALQRLVLQPLQVEAWLGQEPARPPARLAGVRSEHTGTALEPYNSPFWRSLALPYGGLLTTAEGALRLARAYFDQPGGLLSAALRGEAVADQTNGLGGGMAPPLLWPVCPWGLGPELRDAKAPHWAPAQASPASFGHAGASGCVAWVDPEHSLSWAILGTTTADNGWLVRSGPAIAAALLASLGQQGD